MKHVCWGLVAVMLMFTIGCGQKGRLYIPEPTPEEQAPQTTSTSIETGATSST